MSFNSNTLENIVPGSCIVHNGMFGSDQKKIHGYVMLRPWTNLNEMVFRGVCKECLDNHKSDHWAEVTKKDIMAHEVMES